MTLQNAQEFSNFLQIHMPVVESKVSREVWHTTKFLSFLFLGGRSKHVNLNNDIKCNL